MNKIFSILSIICFVIMAGLASYFGDIMPDKMTFGKAMSIVTFIVYEVICIISFVYFWIKK